MNANLEKFTVALQEKQNFLLFDLEANFIPEEERNGTEVLPEYGFETIQIGYVKFDASFSVITKGSIFVQPKILPILSAYIKNLTGIRQSEVNDWLLFPVALKKFLALFEPKKDILLSYGNYDMKQLFADCILNRISFPFDEGYDWKYSRHCNIKNALAAKLNTKEMGMDSLMKYLKIPLVGKHHNGEDDCMNILSIVRKVFVDLK